MNNQAHCSCITIKFRPKDCGGGMKRERWMCTECGCEYSKRSTMDALARECSGYRDKIRIVKQVLEISS